jgi:hypothetical protein
MSRFTWFFSVYEGATGFRRNQARTEGTEPSGIDRAALISHSARHTSSVGALCPYEGAVAPRMGPPTVDSRGVEESDDKGTLPKVRDLLRSNSPGPALHRLATAGLRIRRAVREAQAAWCHNTHRSVPQGWSKQLSNRWKEHHYFNAK